jgi:5'-nucleotidase
LTAKYQEIFTRYDDGYDASGIKAMGQALKAAGHNVTLVASIHKQSGSGVRITTSGKIGFEKKDDGVWAIEGSPADAVLIDLQHILADQPPDLVISGANFGENVGMTANYSGTVGAAIMAMQRGVPAIAISVGFLPEESRPNPSTLAAFGPAAAFTVSLVADLQNDLRENDGLLPDRTLLIVNYPARPSNLIKGIRFTQLGPSEGYHWDFVETEAPGELLIKYSTVPELTGDAPFDTIWFQRDYITISVLDGDWSAATTVQTAVSSRLSNLKLPVGSKEGD